MLGSAASACRQHPELSCLHQDEVSREAGGPCANPKLREAYWLELHNACRMRGTTQEEESFGCVLLSPGMQGL